LFLFNPMMDMSQEAFTFSTGMLVTASLDSEGGAQGKESKYQNAHTGKKLLGAIKAVFARNEELLLRNPHRHRRERRELCRMAKESA